MKNDKFQYETRAYAKTTNFGLVIDREYQLTGRGDLRMVSEKTGQGYCVEWNEIISYETWKSEKKMLYFTTQEMQDNFLTKEEYDIPYYRDLKLQQILNVNSN